MNRIHSGDALTMFRCSVVQNSSQSIYHTVISTKKEEDVVGGCLYRMGIKNEHQLKAQDKALLIGFMLR